MEEAFPFERKNFQNLKPKILAKMGSVPGYLFLVLGKNMTAEDRPRLNYRLTDRNSEVLIT